MTVAAVAIAFAASACGSSDADASDDSLSDVKTMTIIVAGEPGGSFTDAYSRLMTSALEDAADTKFVVENISAGSGVVAFKTLLDQGGDCETINVSPVPGLIYLALSETRISMDDLAPLAKIVDETAVIRVRNDAPWQTLQELVDDAKVRPGEIRVSVSSVNSNFYTAVLDLEEQAGIDLNLVPFDGGGPARTALVAGDVELTDTGLFGSLSIDDDSRVLAVHADENPHPELTDDAQTVSEALGIDSPPSSSTYGYFATSECKKNHPELFDEIAEAIMTAVQSDEFLKELESRFARLRLRAHRGRVPEGARRRA